ncbi:MAG TPA: GAF domain-containing sensor histidine kinase [Acidimicrobiales bacterium]|nr:GAF domain-containing sensor histidine kinase [Acidimicrobiales bacterium]
MIAGASDGGFDGRLLVDLLDRTADAVDASDDADGALLGAVRTVCRHLGTPLGSAYLIAPDQSLDLRAVHLDDAAHPRLTRLRSRTEAFRPSVGEPLPGTVAASGRPMVVPDIVAHPGFARGRDDADRASRTWIGFPIHVSSGVSGVVELFAAGVHHVDDVVLSALHHVGAQVGHAVERHRFGAHLAVLEQARTAFLGRAAHELRTPVGTLSLALTTLIERGDRLGADDRQQLLATAGATLDHLRALTGSLLELTELESNLDPSATAPVAVRPLLEQLVATLPPDLAARVVVDVPQDDVVVHADATALDRILHGLFVNAWQHGGPTIVVELAADRDRVTIAVTDDGPGVAPEMVPSLFEPFTRRRGTNSNGLGLGLAVSRRLAESFGATLTYAPADPTGSRFEVVVPREPA